MNDYTKWFWEAMAKELTPEQLEVMKGMVEVDVVVDLPKPKPRRKKKKQ
jgi:hypothetical protein